MIFDNKTNKNRRKLAPSLHEGFVIGPRLFYKRAINLVTQPVFLSLTLIGNMIILFGASSFYFVERNINPKLGSFLDALWWSVATATTVGYGDVSPVSVEGKWVGIVMMLLGTTLFCSFTALFSAALLTDTFNEVESKIEEELHTDELILDKHLSQIEASLNELKNLRIKKNI